MPSFTARCELSLPACTVLGCEVRELSLYWVPWQGQAVIFGLVGSILACSLQRGDQVSLRGITAQATVCETIPAPAPGSRLVPGKPKVEVTLQAAKAGVPGLVQAGINVTVSYEFTPLAAPVPVTPASLAPEPLLRAVASAPASPPPQLPPAPVIQPLAPPGPSVAPRPPEDKPLHESPWGTTIRRYASPGRKLPRAFSSLLLTQRPRR